MWREKPVSHYVQEVKRNGYTVLEGFLPVESVNAMAENFPQYLETRMRAAPDRGPSRFYLTLPFIKPFADQKFFADAFLLEIIEGIVGKDPVMCQLAADTPLKGSDYQTIHRDTEALFFDSPTYGETPAFQLALNFPLCDVPDDSWGPLQIAKATHQMTSFEQNDLIASGNIVLDTLYMKKGDAIIRDVRGLHRGTPNSQDVPRPMIVVGYSRRWLRRPEVGVKIPQSLFDELSPQAKHLLRFEPIVSEEEVRIYDGKEKYDADTLTKASGHSISLE